MQKKTVKNMAANFGGKIVTMFSSYLFVPLYIRYLGRELYGLVTFYATLQSVMLLLGMGLSSTLRREFADTESSSGYKYRLLRAAESLYVIVMLVIIAICYFGRGLIAEKWLNAEGLGSDIVQGAVSVMGISIAFHLQSNLYSGCLMGAGRQVMANVLQGAWAVIRSGCAVFVLAFIKTDILLFFGVQAAADGVYVLVLRAAAAGGLREKKKFAWRDFAVLKDIWAYTLGMLGISAVSMISVQLDKMIVASEYHLEDVGVYATAYTFSQIPNSIVTILMAAVYNELIYVYRQKDHERMAAVYNSYYIHIQLFASAAAVYMSGFSKELLWVWTQDHHIAASAELPARVLLLGTCLLSMQQVPYYFLLAAGKTKYNNFLGAGILLLNILLTPRLIRLYGLAGAAFAFAVLRLIEYVYLSAVIQTVFMKQNYFLWCWKNNILPAGIVLICAMPFQWIIKMSVQGSLMRVAAAMAGGMITLAVSWYLLICRKHGIRKR